MTKIATNIIPLNLTGRARWRPLANATEFYMYHTNNPQRSYSDLEVKYLGVSAILDLTGSEF